MVQHMPRVHELFTSEQVNSVEQCLELTCMDKDGTYANQQEVVTLSHLLNVPVFVYVPATELNRLRKSEWVKIHPGLLDPSWHSSEVGDQSIYIINRHLHFEVVLSTLPVES